MGNMETLERRASPEVSDRGSAFLVSLIRRFEGGVTEGHFHTLLYVGHKLDAAAPKYDFGFHQFLPFSEELDLKIAMLLWTSAVRIRDNRIRAAGGPAPVSPVEWPASLDKLMRLSYDHLKFLAAVLHLEQDLRKSRQEAFSTAVQLFPIQEDQARTLVQFLRAS